MNKKKKSDSNKKPITNLINTIKSHNFLLPLIIIIVSLSILVGAIIYKQLKNNSKKEPCIVQFESNGGTAIKEQKLICGQVVDKPTDPEKEGFIFKHWKYNEEEYDFSKPVLVDIKLNAVYDIKEGVETVTITFDTSGGSTMEPITIKKGEILNKPVDPSMPGYKFSGWYKDYVEYDFSLKVEENITLKAKWEEKTITNTTSNNNTPPANHSSNKYKCFGYFRSDVPEKNVSVGYSDHVNWTWSTGGVTGTDEVCQTTYKTSNPSVATVSDKGIITAIKGGTTYISECIVDIETKTEVTCFKGKLTVQDGNDNTSVLSKYDEIVNPYVGDWYLEGYSDVLITVSKYKMYYEAMDIMPLQVDIYSSGGIYPTSGYQGIQISYADWDKDIKKYHVNLKNSYISIQSPIATYKFVRTKGTKNKYSNTLFYPSLGTWYVYNRPELSLRVYKQGDDTNPRTTASYCIEYNNFDINTLDYTNSGGTLDCQNATSNELFNRYGITISNNEMTITNSNGSVKLYKTPKTIPVNNITLNKQTMNLLVGEAGTIAATIAPANAYNKNIVWTSSNPSVATVSEGTVQAIGVGTAIITATSQDGNKTAQCTVTVTKIDVIGISLNNENLTLIKGNQATLVATINPNNATYKDISWNSSNPSVATVSNGVITALSVGTTTITVTSQDGNKTAQCTVTVTNPPLTGKASIGLSTYFSNNTVTRGIDVSISASGGNGIYNYYYIKLYKDGTLIGQTSNTNSNTLFVPGYTNGNYYVEFEVRDSEGTKYSGTSPTTSISGF